MKIKIAWIVLFCLVAAAAAVAVENKGSKDIVLDTRKQGIVNFPHHMHQSTIGDCSVCHSIFPQEKGAIQNAVANKALKKKQVMNKTCIKCHRDLKKAGKTHGPTSCKKCHVK